MILDKKTQRIFDKEMRIPCHINHIADRIFKLKREETSTIINQMITDGIVEESCLAKNYYKKTENV